VKPIFTGAKASASRQNNPLKTDYKTEEIHTL